jgi:ribosome-associated toxin RatA of RatAB toxin-antitoxin module
MAEKAEGNTTIDATPDQVMAVIGDFDSYPGWADVKSAEVKETDSEGRASEVAMSVSQMGFDAAYTLQYTYAADDAGLSWTTKEASGAVKDIQGEYQLEPEGDGKTKVTFQVQLEPNVKLPGFLKRQIEKMIVNNALGGLKKEVERRSS